MTAQRKKPIAAIRKPCFPGRNLGRILPMLLLFGAIALPSCGAVQTSQANFEGEMEESAVPPAAAPMPTSQGMTEVTMDMPQADTTVAQATPQLIKKASLTIEVEAIADNIDAVSQIVKQKQGDVLSFQDNKPRSPNVTRHLVSMQLRVPQQQLESTINALAELGTVLNRSLTAEDVSTQLIDNDARLKNLRKSEEMVLKIMERSGSVGDVLNAARELSSIREQIERIEAMQKNLRSQVAYSTISLTLESPVSPSEIPQTPLGEQLQDTWGNATTAVGSFAVGLLKIGLYLLAFSPFLLLAVGAVLAYKKLHKSSSENSPPNGVDNSASVN